MGQFFGSIYCCLEEFFGLPLANYLWGISSPDQQTNMFFGIGLSMFGISAFMMILYYYIIDHPKLSKLWGWSIFLCANAVINFLVGWQWVLRDSYEGQMVCIDETTLQRVPLEITEGDIACFGVSNMLLSILAFIIFSYLLKWWSNNCSSAPF